jgi:hypothetical protein
MSARRIRAVTNSVESKDSEFYDCYDNVRLPDILRINGSLSRAEDRPATEVIGGDRKWHPAHQTSCVREREAV